MRPACAAAVRAASRRPRPVVITLPPAGFSRFIVRWLDFHHAEQQWRSLRCWISSTVLLRDPPKQSLPPACASDAHAHEALAVVGEAGVARWPHACGNLPTGVGAPPLLVPLEEVASALALVGFTAALQATDVMDSTLSGVVLVRRSSPYLPVGCGCVSTSSN